MKDNENIFNQFKNLAESSSEDFPNSEKVWNKIEHKLDKKVLKTKHKLWQQIAVAASILLVVSIVYQFSQSTPKNNNTTNETVVVKDSIVLPQSDKAVASKENTVTTPTLKSKPQIDKILKKQTALSTSIGYIDTKEVQNEVTTSHETSKEIVNKKLNLEVNTNASFRNVASATPESNNKWYGSKKYDAVVVEKDQYKPYATFTQENQKIKKEEPIVVIDGEVASKDDLNDDDIDIESVLHLSNPLYIINGITYTEQELFGPNPTSPYYPLKKQIIESFTVLEKEKAIALYGKKAENGIVIITTKDGKPREKK